MSMDIVAKFVFAVFVIGDSPSNDYFPWAETVRDSSFGREHIQPENTCVDKFNNKAWREATVGEQVIDATRLLFYRSDVPFDPGYMFAF